MTERYIAAVDLGSSKIALTVARIVGDDIEILYYKERPSEGIRNSAVYNPQKAAAPIMEAVKEVQQELRIEIMQVVVSLPRCYVRQEVAEARVTRNNPDDSITLEEVNSLKSIAQDKYPLKDPDTEELYGAIAQSFSSDEGFQLIESDIVGVISSSFSGNFKLFIGKKSAVRNIDKVFNNLNIAIAREYFSPWTVSKAVLTQDEMENGVALIDFGGGATSVTIYKGKILRYYASIPFGGKTITSDIQSECSISERLAENIKLAYGVCMPDRLQNLEDKIIQIEDSDIEGYKQIPVKFLSEIVTARVNEIVQAILYEIQQSGYADRLRNGVVITGGGALLANLPTFIRESSGYTVRIGYPRHLFSATGCDEIYGPSATNSLGMILAAKEDGLLNCIESVPAEPEETYEPSETVVYDPPVETEHGGTEEEHVNQEDAHNVTDTGGDEEAPGNLFGPEEKKDEKVKDGKQKKKDENKKKEKDSSKVTWIKKFSNLFNGLYDGVGDEIENEGV